MTGARRGSRLRCVVLVVLAAAALVALAEWVAPEPTLHAALALVHRSAGFRARTIPTRDGEVPYLDGGAGDVVVLLHGFQDSKESWVAVARRLIPRYHVVIPDLHGFGDNHARTDGDYTPPAQARRVKALLDALQLAQVNIAGVSMGGEVAAAFAAQYPAQTRTLALFSSAGTRSDTLTPLGARVLHGDNIFHVVDMQTLDTLIAAIADSGMVIPAVIKRSMLAEYRVRGVEWDSIFSQLTEPAMLYLVDSLAPGIDAPTLVVWGASDPLFHRSTAWRLGARLPHAEVTVLRDCGHLCPATRPAEVAARYLKFLAGVAITR